METSQCPPCRRRVVGRKELVDTPAESLAGRLGLPLSREPGGVRRQRRSRVAEVAQLSCRQSCQFVPRHLERAKEAGVRAAVGGSALPGPGFFVAPTVLIDVTNDHEVAREEIFGPVVTVEKFSDEEEAVRRANAVPYPPTAARTPASLARSRWRGTNWHDCRQLSCATSATRERR